MGKLITVFTGIFQQGGLKIYNRLKYNTFYLNILFRRSKLPHKYHLVSLFKKREFHRNTELEVAILKLESCSLIKLSEEVHVIK